MRDSKHAIEIDQLTKYYGNQQALQNVTLRVRRGDFFAFLGPNGAGKTTTINVLTGLSNFQGGHAKIFGYDTRREYLFARRLVGLCAQEFNFDPFLKIRDLLVFQAGYFGILPPKAARRADELLKRFNLYDKRNVKHRALSGGMKKRLLLCRALIHDPEIIILDEPTAGMAAEQVPELMTLIQQIQQQGSKTVVLVEHNMNVVMSISDRITVMHQGRVLAEGAPAEIAATDETCTTRFTPAL